MNDSKKNFKVIIMKNPTLEENLFTKQKKPCPSHKVDCVTYLAADTQNRI